MKKLLGIVVLGLSLSGNGYAGNQPLFEFENKRFTKKSIGHLSKIKKIRKKCTKDPTGFYGVSKCYANLIYEKEGRNPYANLNLSKVIYNQMTIQFLLFKLDIITEQEAFDNLDSFLFSGLNSKKKLNNTTNLQNLSDCTKNNFSLFVQCLDKNFRSWKIYNETSPDNRIIFEQIIAFAKILDQRKKINLNPIFSIDIQKTDKDTMYWLDDSSVSHYGNFHYKKYTDGRSGYVMELFKKEDDEMYYLNSDEDGYNFIDMLIKHYTSNEYEKYLQTVNNNKQEYTNYRIAKYKDKSFLEKLEYRVSDQAVDDVVDVMNIALTIYTAHRIIEGETIFSRDKSIKNNTEKNLNQFNNKKLTFKYGPNSFLNKTFKYNSNSVFNRKWFRYKLLY